MSVAELGALPVQSLANSEGCALFMWTTGPMLPQALEVIRLWGFTYKTVFTTWVKTSSAKRARVLGPGNYSRSGSELLLVALRGRGAFSRLRGSSGDRSIPQVVDAVVQQHSRKPDVVYDLIERFLRPEMRGVARKVELFARRRREGWVAWGNEV